MRFLRTLAHAPGSCQVRRRRAGRLLVNSRIGATGLSDRDAQITIEGSAAPGSFGGEDASDRSRFDALEQRALGPRMRSTNGERSRPSPCSPEREPPYSAQHRRPRGNRSKRSRSPESWNESGRKCKTDGGLTVIYQRSCAFHERLMRVTSRADRRVPRPCLRSR